MTHYYHLQCNSHVKFCKLEIVAMHASDGEHNI